MKCPKCGYISFDHLEACKKCQANLVEPRHALGLAEGAVSAAALEAAANAQAAEQAQAAAELVAEERVDAPVAGEPIAEEPVAEEPVDESIVDEPGFELDTAALEGAGPEGPQVSEASKVSEVKAAAMPELIPVELSAEDIVEDIAEDMAVSAALEPVSRPVVGKVPEEASEEAPGVSLAQATAPEQAAPASGGKKPGLELELPAELAALMADAAAAEDEAAEEAPEDEAVTLAPDLELDDELKRFLEQEGTSLEELESAEQKSDDDNDDDAPQGPAASGGGRGGKQGGKGAPLSLSPEGEGGSGMACEGDEPRRAPLWMRGLALALDAGLISVLVAALLASSAAAFVWAARHLGPAADPASLLRLAVVMAPLALCFSLPVLSLAYFTCFHGLSGSTPGKMLLGLQVRSLCGGRLGCGRAFLRSVGYLLSAIPLAMGFLWAGGSERLAWHDLMAGSEVLRA